MRIITVARKINTYSDGEVVGKSSMTHGHKRKTEIKKTYSLCIALSISFKYSKINFRIPHYRKNLYAKHC